MLYLLVFCFPNTVAQGTGECRAVSSYPTRQECRAAARDVQRAARGPTNYFVACAAAPGVGR